MHHVVIGCGPGGLLAAQDHRDPGPVPAAARKKARDGQ